MSTLELLKHKVCDNVERSYAAEGQGLALKDLNCLLSELELFLVGNPVSREQFDTEIWAIRLPFRSVSGSSVEEDGSEGTDRETDHHLGNCFDRVEKS